MKKVEIRRLPLGLYRLYWKSGGYSLACVGQLHDGTRWHACANWTSKSEEHVTSTDWRSVKYIEEVECK